MIDVLIAFVAFYWALPMATYGAGMAIGYVMAREGLDG